MNERIRELRAQCAEESIDGPGYPYWVDQEKFALLIVKDCLDAIRNVEEQFFNGRIATDDFVEKNRYAEGETVCRMVKHEIEMRYGVK